jgi:transcriptional regulator with XRE-family HTH domain
MEMEVEKSFADYLREERLKQGMTTYDLSKKVGISQSYISHIENKKWNPHEKMKIMAEGLGMDFSELEEKVNLQIVEESPDLLINNLQHYKIPKKIKDFIVEQNLLGVKRTTIAKMAGIAKVYVNHVLVKTNK